MKILPEIQKNKKYCVFFHTDMDGIPFYLGCATVKRAYKLEKSRHKGEGTNRSKAYKDKIESLNYQYKVQIVEYYDNKDSARELLLSLYEVNKSTLLNKVPKSKIAMSQDLLSKLFYIDSDSITGIKYLNTNEPAGVVFNSKRSKYWTIDVNGKTVLVHRIIMCLLGYDLSDKIVDHVDGNGLNNDQLNLRVVDNKINSRNNSKAVNNKTGYTGVSRYESTYVHYIASWVEHGVQRHKRFNPKKVGGEEIALQMAIQARAEAIERLNALGYNYTERHGKD